MRGVEIQAAAKLVRERSSVLQAERDGDLGAVVEEAHTIEVDAEARSEPETAARGAEEVRDDLAAPHARVDDLDGALPVDRAVLLAVSDHPSRMTLLWLHVKGPAAFANFADRGLPCGYDAATVAAIPAKETR